MENGPGISDGARQVLEKASTGMVNDALALAGIQGSVVGIRPVRGFEDTKIIGPASTIFLAPPHPDTPPKSMYAAIREQPRGNVLVIDGGGWEANFTGDNNGHCALRQGLVGIVVGATRFLQVAAPFRDDHRTPARRLGQGAAQRAARGARRPHLMQPDA